MKLDTIFALVIVYLRPLSVKKQKIMGLLELTKRRSDQQAGVRHFIKMTTSSKIVYRYDAATTGGGRWDATPNRHHYRKKLSIGGLYARPIRRLIRGSRSQAEAEARERAEAKPTLSSYTVALIRRKVMELLRDQNGSCSLFEVINAIQSDRKIFDAHADPEGFQRSSASYNDLEDLARRVKESLNVLSNSSSNNYERKQRKEMLSRRYQLINALDNLQNDSKEGVRKIVVTSWDTARDHLMTVLEFPSEEPPESRSDLGSALSLGKTHALDQVEQFRKRIEAMKLERVGLQASEAALLQIARTPAYEEEHDFETKRLEREYEKVHRKSDAVKLYEERLKKMEQEEEARKMISSIMRPFSAEERKMVQDVLNTIGPESEILYKDGTDTIQRGSIQTLRPGQWLNDEVVHYFLVMLAKRDEEMCRQNPSRKRSHFFKSFFFTTLLNEGHANPAINGTYEYRNVKRWSKKVPGKVLQCGIHLWLILLQWTSWHSQLLSLFSGKVG